jgi:hypothetical protein
VKVRACFVCGGFKLGKGLFLDGHHRDVVAEAPGTLEDQEREPAVPGNEADPAHDRGAAPEIPPEWRRSTSKLEAENGVMRYDQSIRGLLAFRGRTKVADGCFKEQEGMRRSFLGAVMMVAFGVMAAGCDNVDESFPTPTTPAPTVTESFSGAITVNGAETKTFTTVASGSVTVTLTTLAPDAAATVGLALGTWNSLDCQVAAANDAALQGTSIVRNVTGLGILCVRIYDVGKLTAGTEYTVQVVHP